MSKYTSRFVPRDIFFYSPYLLTYLLTYILPEQWEELELTAKTDVYALGLTLTLTPNPDP